MIAPDFRGATNASIEAATKNFITFNYGKHTWCGPAISALVKQVLNENLISRDIS